MSKKGQVTLFVILGLVIVVAGLLIFIYKPDFKGMVFGEEMHPHDYLRDCIQEDFQELTKKTMLQGGFTELSNFYMFEDERLGYLCYTAEYYKKCSLQVPFVRDFFQQNLNDAISKKASDCLTSLEQAYRDAGDSITISSKTSRVEIKPNSISLTVGGDISTRVKEESKNYEPFVLNIRSGAYEMLGVAKSILEFESMLGEADATELMSLYRDLKIEKIKQTEGTKIYRLTNKNTKEVFQFASRSVVSPPGYL